MVCTLELAHGVAIRNIPPAPWLWCGNLYVLNTPPSLRKCTSHIWRSFAVAWRRGPGGHKTAKDFLQLKSLAINLMWGVN